MAVNKDNKTEEKVLEDKKLLQELEAKTAELEKINKLLAEREKEMKEISQSVEDLKQSKGVKTTTRKENITIPVYSLVPNMLVISAKEGGGEPTYKFPSFGHKERIRRSDLVDILRIHRKQFDANKLYVDDQSFLIEEGYEYLVDNISSEKIKEIVLLENDNCLNMIFSFSNDMQENIAVLIAENIAKGHQYNYNYIKKLEEKGFKLDELAEQFRAEDGEKSFFEQMQEGLESK